MPPGGDYCPRFLPIPTHDGRVGEAVMTDAVFHPSLGPALRDVISRRVQFTKVTDEGERPAHPPA